MGGLILRIIRQMLNDKRLMALVFLAPLLLLTLLYLLLGESSYQPVVGVGESFTPRIAKALEEGGTLQIRTVWSEEDRDVLLTEKEIDAYLSLDEDGIHILMLEANGTIASKITEALKDAMEKFSPAGSIHLDFLYGKPDDTLFNAFAPVLLGVLAFFFVFIVSGIAFVRERTSGTMERLMMTPVSRLGVITGYTMGYGLFAALQSIFLVLFARYALGMSFSGSVPLAMLMMVLLAFTAVLMGALVSIFANNEFQVMQFIPVVVIPQIFFSGMIPIETLPLGLGNLAYVLPVYYGCSGLQEIVTRGVGFDALLRDIGALAAMIVLFLILNTQALRKYRRL